MVSEKDLQSYLKVAASALPCREARKEFSSYVHNVAHDISIENPDADFATVASLLGTTPKQVAADFVESQSPQTISRWNRSAHRYKYGLQLLVGIETSEKVPVCPTCKAEMRATLTNSEKLPVQEQSCLSMAQGTDGVYNFLLSYEWKCPSCGYTEGAYTSEGTYAIICHGWNS